jgi:hypothetical protein
MMMLLNCLTREPHITVCAIYRLISFYLLVEKDPMGRRDVRNRANRESIMNFFHKWYDLLSFYLIGDF